MKVQQTAVLAARHEFAIRAESMKMGKAKADDGEIQACFSKLKDLVPTIPKEKKLSKTQFLQHVIDYIFDLEVALECHPAMSQLISQSMSNNNRLPLAECSRDNEQFLAKHTELLEERVCDRPVSC